MFRTFYCRPRVKVNCLVNRCRFDAYESIGQIDGYAKVRVLATSLMPMGSILTIAFAVFFLRPLAFAWLLRFEKFVAFDGSGLRRFLDFLELLCWDHALAQLYNATNSDLAKGIAGDTNLGHGRRQDRIPPGILR